MVLNQPVVDRIDLLLRFTSLTSRNAINSWLKTGSRKILRDSRRIQVIKIAIGHQKYPRREVQLFEIVRQTPNSTPIDNCIIAIPNLDTPHNWEYFILCTHGKYPLRDS